MPPLRLLFLGPPAIEREGAPVTLTRAKEVALLAYLAVSGERHGRAALATLLWPEFGPERALAALRNTIWRLSRELGESWLAADRTGMRITEETAREVDTARFLELAGPTRPGSGAGASPPPLAPDVLRRLAEAAALHRGVFLQGLTLPDCAEFDDWQSQQTEHHRRRWLETLETLVQGYLARGMLEPALPHAQRWVTVDALNEGAWRQLMLLCAWTGRRAEALQAFERCAAVLGRELGERPSPETARLWDTLKSGREPPPPPAREAPAPRAWPGGEPTRTPAPPPLPTTPLVGRREELERIRQQLATPGCRLVSLLGPGGVGKTRLALETALRLEASYPDGVCFVPLGAVETPEGLPAAIAAALGLPAAEPASVESGLAEHLRSRRLLLILDGFEHVLPAAPRVQELLARTRGAQLLITSRERLYLPGEWEAVLEGLACPETPEAAPEGGDAVSLFVQAATRVAPAFTLPPEDVGAVAGLCRALGGLPLAIELAAAGARHATPRELAARVEQDLDLLPAPQGIPERQRRLRTLFEDAWRRLSGEERQALRRLSVFPGGCTAEAAEAVAGARLPVLQALMDRFLVRRTPARRYVPLETLRPFAAEALRAEGGEEAEVRDRHADFFTALLAPRSALDGPRQAEVLRRLAAERDNLRAALCHAVERGAFPLLERALDGWGRLEELRGRFDEAQALLASWGEAARHGPVRRGEPGARRLLGRVLTWRGRFALEGASLPVAAALIQEALALLGQEDPTEELLLAQQTAGLLALKQGAHTSAEWCFRGCLELGRALGDRHAMAVALADLAGVATRQREYPAATRLLDESLALLRALGDRRRMAACYRGLGDLLGLQGELERAQAAYQEALRTVEGDGEAEEEPHERALLLELLARLKAQRGDAAGARADYEESLALARRLRYPERVAAALHGLGWLDVQAARPEAARRHLEEALALRQRLHASRGVAETLNVLAQVLEAQGEAGPARDCLRAALQAALEIDDMPLVLESLVGLAARAGDRPEPLQRALEVLATHPMADLRTRQRAEALRGGPPPAVPVLSLSELIAAVLG